MARRFKTCIICTLGIFLFLLVPFSLLAKDIYVATNGNDSTGTGAVGAPYLTVNKAQSVVACGDTIYMRGGTYGGTNKIGSNYDDNRARCVSYSAPVTIRNYMSEHVIIQPGASIESVLGFTSGSKYPARVSYYWKIIATAQNDITFDCVNCLYQANSAMGGLNGDYIWLENIEVINSYHSGILPHGDYWTLVNLNVHNNGTCGLYKRAHGIYWTGVGLLIEGGSYHDNAGFGIHIFDSGSSSVDDNVIRNARIYGNNKCNEGDGGIILSTGHRNLAYNNLIYSNKGDGLYINYRCNACAAYNNTIYGNSNNAIVVGDGGGNAPAVNTILKNNLLNSNLGTISDSGTGTVISNNYTGGTPGLTNAAIADFTLQPSSSAIGGGINLSTLFTTDFAGKLRAVGKSEFDIGAFEYAPATTDTTPPQVSISVIAP